VDIAPSRGSCACASAERSHVHVSRGRRPSANVDSLCRNVKKAALAGGRRHGGTDGGRRHTSD
jgi:hypothetical protein